MPENTHLKRTDQNRLILNQNTSNNESSKEPNNADIKQSTLQHKQDAKPTNLSGYAENSEKPPASLDIEQIKTLKVPTASLKPFLPIRDPANVPTIEMPQLPTILSFKTPDTTSPSQEQQQKSTINNNTRTEQSISGISSNSLQAPPELHAYKPVPAPGPQSPFTNIAANEKKDQSQPTKTGTGTLRSGVINNTSTPKPAFWQRAANKYNQYSRKTKIMLAVLAFCILLPTLLTLVEGINAVVLYTEARSGIQHLQNIKTIFTNSQGHSAGYLDINRLHQAQQEVDAAHNDFVQLRANLEGNPLVGLLGVGLPQQITTMRSLSVIGVNTIEIVQELMKTAIKLAPTFRDPLQMNSDKPLITQNTLNLVQHSIKTILPSLQQIEQASHSVTLDSLPISDQQRQQLAMLLQAIPQAHTDLQEASNLMGAIGWILGIDHPRNFLVQTMDRAELRATGGFTGQFGNLSINGGRMAPFELQNIGPYEESLVGVAPDPVYQKIQGQKAPAPYDNWWPIANFGLRDSNVSADFPTSAKIAMNVYNFEFGKQVDGVISFSPFLITHVLQVTGPIKVPGYNETITAQNLEDRLHYYQLDNLGIAKEIEVEHIPPGPEAGNQARKLFTKRVSQLLMDHVRKAPPDEIIALASEMLYAMKTRDLQVYVANDEVEQLIAKYGSTAAIDRSTDHDGLFVVQSNVSVSKASQYVRTQINDTVTLDEQGGATHEMTMHLNYAQLGPVYGWDTYRDYVRVYVPPTARLISGHGFDAGFDHPYCYTCKQDVYGDGALICPAGNQTYFAPWWTDDPYGPDNPHPLNKIGPPTQLVSDEPGRAMFAGWVTIPKNCNMTIKLSWYVPAMASSSHPYSLLVQRQSSTFPQLDLTIRTTPESCSQLHTDGLHYKGVLGGPDRTFTPAINKTDNRTNGQNKAGGDTCSSNLKN